MKKLTFTLLSVMLFLGAFAHHNSSSTLNVRAWDNSSFTLVLNGVPYQHCTRAVADNLTPGRHCVKIVKRYSSPYSCGTINRTVYNGTIDIPRSSVVQAQFRPNCGLTITEVIPVFTGPTCGHGHPFGQCGFGCQAPVDNGAGYGVDNGFDNGFGGQGQGQGNGWDDGDYYDNVSNGHNGHGGFGNGHNGNNGNGYNGNNGNGGFGNGNMGNGHNMNGSMNQQQFQNLKYQIRNTPFDSDKLRIARQAIRANGVRPQQVRQLMEMMSFESNRLKLAKFAYQFSSNRQNYFVVNSAFQFSSSVRELNRHINGFG